MVTDYSQWYERVYPELSGAGLWLRGGELNTLDRSQFDKRPFKVLITRLSSYRDTADSFTHTLLYQIVAGLEGVFCDLAYLPPPRDAEIFIKENVPWILGTSTKLGPDAFNVIALSNSIAQELINLPSMLTKSGISLSKKERMSMPDVPLIIMGGANALHTPVLFNDDPMVDGIFAGEDPALIKKLFSLCLLSKAQGMSKEETLSVLESLEGFVQPDKPRSTVKRAAPMAGMEELVQNRPVPFIKDNAGRASIGISEGCACFCSFCAESWGRKPYRELEFSTVLSDAARLKATMGLDSIDIYSFNFNMYSELYRVLWGLSDNFSSIGLKSQRFDFIPRDTELLKFVHVLGKSSLTCGLEGISPRLRRFLQKGIDEHELAASIRMLIKAPLRELKIFLIATGREQPEDYDAFRDFLRMLSSAMESCGRRPRIIFSMTPLVRFPHTPLEFDDAPEEADVRSIMQQTARIVRSRNFEFRDSAGAQESWLSQLLVRSSDKRVMKSLVNSVVESGFVYTSEVTVEFAQLMRRKLTELNVDLKAVLAGVSPDDNVVHPWMHIDTGVSREFLVKMYQDCKEQIDEGYCLGTRDMAGSCRGCGACENETMKGKITAVRTPMILSSEKLKEKLRKDKTLWSSLFFHIETNESKRGIPAQLFGAALASAIMTLEPQLTTSYRHFGNSWRYSTLCDLWAQGDDIISLVWHSHVPSKIKEVIGGRLDEVNGMLESWMKVLSVSDLYTTPQEYQITFDSPFPINTNDGFNTLHLKATTRKTGPDRYIFDFSSTSLKKKILKSMSCQRRADGKTSTTLVPGEKYEHQSFVSTVFKAPNSPDIVRVKRKVGFLAFTNREET